MLNEWAYNRVYGSSAERTATLPAFLERYTTTDDHTAPSANSRPPQG